MEWAKLPRKTYGNIGIPNLKNFKHMVSINMISNCPIPVGDTINSENIYGPSVASLKGKSTRIKPRPIIKDGIQVPIEIYKFNSKIELCIDVVYINGIAFLVSIDRQVKCRSIIHITYQNEEFSKALTKYFKSIIQQDS